MSIFVLFIPAFIETFFGSGALQVECIRRRARTSTGIVYSDIGIICFRMKVRHHKNATRRRYNISEDHAFLLLHNRKVSFEPDHKSLVSEVMTPDIEYIISSAGIIDPLTPDEVSKL